MLQLIDMQAIWHFFLFLIVHHHVFNSQRIREIMATTSNAQCFPHCSLSRLDSQVEIGTMLFPYSDVSDV